MSKQKSAQPKDGAGIKPISFLRKVLRLKADGKEEPESMPPQSGPNPVSISYQELSGELLDNSPDELNQSLYAQKLFDDLTGIASEMMSLDRSLEEIRGMLDEGDKLSEADFERLMKNELDITAAIEQRAAKKPVYAKEACEVLSSGRITSPEAQDLLAAVIATCEHEGYALDALESLAIKSDTAKTHLARTVRFVASLPRYVDQERIVNIFRKDLELPETAQIPLAQILVGCNEPGPIAQVLNTGRLAPDTERMLLESLYKLVDAEEAFRMLETEDLTGKVGSLLKGKVYCAVTPDLAYDWLISGKLKTAVSQELFAEKISKEGTVEFALEILGSRKVTSEEAQLILAKKITDEGTPEQARAANIRAGDISPDSKRMLWDRADQIK